MKSKLLVILALLFLVSGCWSYTELNNLAIITGIAIDKKDGEYEFSLLISNSQKSSSNAKETDSQVVVLKTTSHDIDMAFKQIDLKSPKETYMGHISILIVSEDVAKEGLTDILDFLMRQPSSRKDFHLLLAKDCKASDILTVLSPMEAFPSENISANIQSSGHLQAVFSDMIYSEFFSKLYSEGIDPMLPGIIIEGDADKSDNMDSLKDVEPNAILSLSELGVFDEENFLGWTTEDESRGINILKNTISVMAVEASCGEDSKLVADIANLNTDIQYKIVDSKPRFSIDIKASGAIGEVDCKMDLDDPKVMEEFNHIIEKKIYDMVDVALHKIQKEYKSDVIGFGSMIYKKNPKYWNEIKDKWKNEIFPSVEMDIKVSVSIESKGAIGNPIKEGV